MASCPGPKLLCTVLKQRKRKKNLPSFAHVLENLKFGHSTDSTLLFCRGRQRNVLKCKTHVQSDCFGLLSLLFSGVLVAVAVVVA